jgi:lipoyl(octanoyl) transferase
MPFILFNDHFRGLLKTPMLKFEDWGQIDYQSALDKQLAKVQQVIETQEPGYLIFCSHPPIVTLGRKTQPGDVFGWSGPTLEVSRGGRATYHGPSQLVVYPILNMELAGEKRRAKDISSLFRTTEEAICKVLKKYKIDALGKTDEKITDLEDTGVWIGRQKVASLGVAIKKWVSYHGAAINIDEDPNAFSGMKPCGFNAEIMVSLEKVTKEKINRADFSEQLKTEMLNSL